jgi:hypothetical protein
LKKRNIFYVTLENIGDNLYETAKYFEESLKSKNLDVREFAAKMKEAESQGDRYTQIIYNELNKTFMPPLESEDILTLNSTLDDVLDGLEAFAARLDMYHIKEINPWMVQFAENLSKSCHEINAALRLIPVKKMNKIREHAIRINELENEADDLLRTSIRELFATTTDAIEIIKLKDLFEILEETSDRCEDVADTLESIIMTNS